MQLSKIKSIFFLKLISRFFQILGIFFSIQVLLSLTTLPYWGYHWLGTSKSVLKTLPNNIVLLGGGGMPSNSALMRIWYTRKAAGRFPDAKVTVAMPGDPKDSTSTPVLMKKELIHGGISEKRIDLEYQGTNTRSQALACSKMMNIQTPVLIITSPEHMRRAVLCFQAVGFTRVNALPTFENAVEADLSFDDDQLGGTKTISPDVGNSIQLRYQVWNHLQYEILIVREFLALSYYKIRGWI